MRRRLLRITVVAGAALLLLLAAMHSSPAREFARGRVEEMLRDRGGLAVRIGELDYSLLRMRVEARDVTLAPVERAGTPFLTVGRVVVWVQPPSFTRAFRLLDVDVDRPRLALVRDANGRLNLPASAGAGGAPSEAWTVPDRASLRHLAVSYRDDADGVSVDVADASWLARRVPEGLTGALVLDGYATLRLSGRALTATALAARLRWNGRDLGADEIRATVLQGAPAAAARAGAPVRLGAPPAGEPLARLDATLRLDDVFGEPRLEIDGRGRVALEPLQRWLEVPLGVTGALDVQSRTRGTLASLATEIRAEGNDLRLGRASGIRLASSLILAGGQLALRDATIGIAGGEIRSSGEFGLGGPSGVRQLDARWSSLPMSAVLDALAVTRIAHLDASLDGRSTVRWRGADLTTLDASLANRATPSRSTQALPVSGDSRLRVGGGRWTLEHDHALGSLQVSGSVAGRFTSGEDLGRSAVSGSIAARIDDLAAFARELATVGIAALETTGSPGAGVAWFEGRVEGPLGRPRLLGTLRAKDVRLGEAAPFTLEAALALDPARLTIGSSRVSNGADAVGASGSLALASRTVEGTAKVELRSFDEPWRFASLPEEWLPRGQLDADVRIGGHLSSPRLEATATGALGVKALEPSPVSFEMRLDGTRLSASALRLDTAAGSLTGEGSLDLGVPARPFRASLSATLSDAARLAGAVAPRAWPFAGEWVLRAEGEGELARPGEMAVDAVLERIDGTVAGLPVRLASPARLERRGDVVRVDRLALRSGESRLVLAGSLGQETSLEASLDARFEDLAPLWAALPETWRPALQGTVRFDASLSGPLRRPTLAASLVADAPTAALPNLAPATSVTAAASFRDGRLVVERLAAQWQGATVRGTASLPWRLVEPWLPSPWQGAIASPAGGARLDLDVRDITPETLAPFVPAETLASIGGRASATIALEADHLSARALRGDIVLGEADLTLAQVPLRQRQPTRLVVGDGRLRVATWQWEGPGTSITGAGGLSWDGAEVRFDAALDASVDLRMASVFLRPVSTAGRADVSLSIAGPLRAPTIDGRATVSGGEARVREPRLAISGLEGTVLLIGDQLRLEAVRGTINGGALALSGAAGLRGWSLAAMDFSLGAREAALEFPKGLRSEIDADLRLVRTGGDDPALVSGTVTVLHGRYREQFGPAAQLFSGRATAVTPLSSPTPGPMSALRLDVAVTTREDVDVEIDYGRAEAGAALRVQGTVGAPLVAGRLALREGGTVYLGGNTYRLESGIVDFKGDRTLEPDIDVVARTQVGSYNIRLRMSGRPGTIRAELSSEPSLDRSDIVSLLVTGRTMAQGGLSTHVVGEQVLGYLSGDLLNFAGRAVGLDSVRIDRGLDVADLRFDPTVIAGDTSPASRLTVAKNLTRDVEVALSQDLSGSGKLTWVATWRPRRTLAFRIVSLDEVDRTYEFRQELSFGAPATARIARAARTGSPRVIDVVITGVEGGADALRGRLSLDAGDRFNFYRWQDDRERLLRALYEQNRLEARVSATRAEVKDREGRPGVELRYSVEPGPKCELLVEGVTLPTDTLALMRTEWTEAVFDGFLVEDVARLARTALARQGQLRAVVSPAVESRPTDAGEVKVLRLAIEPGPKTVTREIAWTGNTALDDRRLEAGVAGAGLVDAVWLDPALLEEPLRALYVSEGYLAARVIAGTPEFVGQQARLPVRIVEGPAASLRALRWTGVGAVPAATVEAAARLTPGEPFRPGQLDAARQRIEQAYRERGFNTVRVSTSATSDADGAVDLKIAVTEGARQVLSSVEVVGAERTHPGLVRTALNLETGEPLDAERLYEARRRLYETGAFRQVDLQTEPVGDPEPDGTGGGQQQAMTARVTLEEWPVWRFRYGLQVNDFLDPLSGGRDVGPGLSVDLERANLFGRAATLGASGRYENTRQAVRTFLSTPRFFRWPLSSTLFAQKEWEELGDADIELTGLSFEQRYRAARTLQLNYGMFYRHTKTTTVLDILGQPVPFEALLNYSGLFSAVSVDRRDDLFDTRRGSFSSASLTYAPKSLGSDVRFIKGVLQQSYYQPLGRGVVFASNVRVGLADGFGQEIVPNERFFAGGTSSVRGYKENSLGPRDFLGLELGGEALLVLNEELRFPLWRFIRGVAFLDAGNAFEEPSTIAFGDLEVGAGIGLRFSTPVGLLRFDFGVPVSRGGGLGAGRLHFSFGQVF